MQSRNKMFDPPSPFVAYLRALFRKFIINERDSFPSDGSLFVSPGSVIALDIFRRLGTAITEVNIGVDSFQHGVRPIFFTVLVVDFRPS